MKKEKRNFIWLLLYGLLWSIIIYKSTCFIGSHTSYMPFRLQTLQQMIDYIVYGQKEALNTIKDHNASYYLYLSIFAKIFNLTTPEIIFSRIQTLAVCFQITIYPILIYYLFDKSKWIALLSPLFWFIFERNILVFNKNDSYWVLAWTITIALPILFLLIKRGWDNISLALYLLLLVIMSLGNLPRMHSSFAILCMTVIVLIVKVKKRDDQNIIKYYLYKALLFSLCFVFYYLFVSIVPMGYMKLTNEKGLLNNIPPWHTIYIGYGFEENPYNIIYLDECAHKKVNEIEPGTEYLSDRYFEILKNECIRMWRENPYYFIQSYCRKIILCIKKVVTLYQSIWVIGISFLFTLIKKRVPIYRQTDQSKKNLYLLITLVVLCIESIFPLLAIPRFEYLGM